MDVAARLSDRVLASGGGVSVLPAHAGLDRHDGIGALLRYAA